jgi:uncharacterized protein YdeI (YjbR/CyaY-like superfamily)
MSPGAEQPTVAFASAEEFEAWLEEHGASSDGLWVKMAKKATGIPSIDWDGAVDVALCFGWIDGQRKGLDERYFLQRFTPRRARSPWSKRNVEKVATLTAAGRMRPQGLAEVERAKADGRWDAAYDGPRTMQVPPDLQAELDQDPDAAASFASLTSANRYAILYRLHEAKRPETRARRLEKFVGMLRRGETLH